MCPGDPLGDHGQRAIALAVIFEPVLADEDGMGMSAPPPHQARAGLQHAAGVERTSPFLELSRQDPKAALQGAAGAAMGALLQLIGQPPDDQIATEAQRRSAVIQCPPGAPQLLCRAIDQPGDFTINLGRGLVAKSVASGVVLGGNIEVALGNGFIPAPGDVFQLLTSPSVQGEFNNISVMISGSGFLWMLDNSGTMYRVDPNGTSTVVGDRGSYGTTTVLTTLNGKLWTVESGSLYKTS